MSAEVTLIAGLLVPLILLPLLLAAYALGRRHGRQMEADEVNAALYQMQLAQRRQQDQSFQSVVLPAQANGSQWPSVFNQESFK